MRIVGVIFILTMVFSAIVSIFWYQELQYLLPTPVPENYRVILPDAVINFDKETLLTQQHTRPKLLHFFNPHCPCSRFNLTHFHALKRKYHDQVDFYAVVTGQQKIAPAKKLLEEGIVIVVDEGEKLAKACGVYSTPQAAVIKTDNKLYFRGNYNRSRYCVDQNSNFVQMALDSLVAQKMSPDFGVLATQSYGCSLDREDAFIVQ
jgi:hypothetical protein